MKNVPCLKLPGVHATWKRDARTLDADADRAGELPLPERHPVLVDLRELQGAALPRCEQAGVHKMYPPFCVAPHAVAPDERTNGVGWPPSTCEWGLDAHAPSTAAGFVGIRIMLMGSSSI